MICDFDNTGRCTRCGYISRRTSPVYRICQGSETVTPIDDVDDCLAACRSCDQYTRDGMAEFCERDTVSTETGQRCERQAVQAWTRRLLGRDARCNRWPVANPRIPQACDGCPDLHACRDGRPACRRDLFHPDPATGSEVQAARKFARRAAGSIPPCPRWLGDEPPHKLAGAWISTAEATADCLRLAGELPPDIDAVVGVARSGMPWASLIAMMWHLPLHAICSHTGSITDCGHGWRLSTNGPFPEPRKILIFDDTVFQGGTMGRVLPAVRDRWPAAEITTAVLYVTPEHTRTVDYFSHVAPGHVLEWNFLNHPYWVQAAAVDWDGVLNADWSGGPEDHEYAAWLRDVKPIQVPRAQILPAIITGRCERYRPICEEWLARHGIRTHRLVMWPGEDEARWENHDCARWKADEYAKTDAVWFVESDPAQAQIIAAEQPKRVICPALGRVL